MALIESLAGISSFLLKGDRNEEEIVKFALQEIVRELDIDNAFWAVFENSGEQFSIPFVFNREGRVDKQGVWEHFHVDSEQWFADCLFNERFVFDDIEKMPVGDIKALNKKAGVKSHLAIPIFKFGNVYSAIGVESIRQRRSWTGEELSYIKAMGGIITSFIEGYSDRQKYKQTVDKVVCVLIKALEKRDPYTSGHQNRVSVISEEIAQLMCLPEDQIKKIKLAALVHDIGKISIPSQILCKPGKLTHQEFELIKMHSETGAEILKEAEFDWNIAEIVIQHHERLDGSGYPLGLAAADILLEAKIIAVADVVESMVTNRPYRAALPLETALNELEQNKGRLYDEYIVECCKKVIHNGSRIFED